MRRSKLSKEMIVAKKMTEMLDSLTLDLDRVGIEIAKMSPVTYYNRFITVAEAAAYEKENNGNFTRE